MAKERMHRVPKAGLLRGTIKHLQKRPVLTMRVCVSLSMETQMLSPHITASLHN